jgi:16S rRNA (cytidine1402-2'-O)-methyltransferase
MKNDGQGTLFLVSTPIGNMEDLSQRAISVLKHSDVIACEDTRRTLKLLNRYGISCPLESYHDHNKEKKTPRLLDHLKKGRNVSLVSDAGTPCISDPGFYLVREAIAKDHKLCAIPGANAILPALILSGFPPDRFIFEGYLPKKAGKRRDRILQLREEERTVILFESPFRILTLLDEMNDLLGDRRISVSREMTKIYEETIRGPIPAVIDHFKKEKPKGEFVVVIEGNKPCPMRT